MKANNASQFQMIIINICIPETLPLTSPKVDIVTQIICTGVNYDDVRNLCYPSAKVSLNADEGFYIS